ncbi:DUF3795 domain-containing protein [Carboxylicivirga linearis]|uniref:DUF3795 domain-containing protein n=1 Tax=Carboxylicivirga linearis TaxID=1628157 RepID=A0ABS5JX73_9BACT|nr:DUF3795 domain-containing protein [Carboxylicivirga linearis]MBS2099418.1 DUF3795 domain-containing protein [Carboxylicivirga linearis]
MKTDKPIVNNPELVAYCGLYCGSCSKLKNGKCPGCAANQKATWCKIRTCNIENGFINCAHCTITEPENCKKINNAIGKVFKFIFKTDRIASLQYIKTNGEALYVDKMADLKQMSIKTKQTI